MTKAEIYAFVTSLNDASPVEESLFNTLLNTAQMNRENDRPWVILRTEDSSKTRGTADTFETPYDLATDFRRWYTRYPIILTDAQGNAVKSLREIPINMKNVYRNDDGKFYVDYKLRKLYICGTVPQSLTIRQYYIGKTTLVSAADGNSWDFPSEYHQILGFDVAVMHKLGVDYDRVNAAQADNNALQAALIFKQMEDWDGALQLSSTEGVDYGSSPSGGFGEMSGNARSLL